MALQMYFGIFVARRVGDVFFVKFLVPRLVEGPNRNHLKSLLLAFVIEVRLRTITGTTTKISRGDVVPFMTESLIPKSLGLSSIPCDWGLFLSSGLPAPLSLGLLSCLLSEPLDGSVFLHVNEVKPQLLLLLG